MKFEYFLLTIILITLGCVQTVTENTTSTEDQYGFFIVEKDVYNGWSPPKDPYEVGESILIQIAPEDKVEALMLNSSDLISNATFYLHHPNGNKYQLSENYFKIDSLGKYTVTLENGPKTKNLTIFVNLSRISNLFIENVSSFHLTSKGKYYTNLPSGKNYSATSIFIGIYNNGFAKINIYLENRKGFITYEEAYNLLLTKYVINSTRENVGGRFYWRGNQYGYSFWLSNNSMIEIPTYNEEIIKAYIEKYPPR